MVVLVVVLLVVVVHILLVVYMLVEFDRVDVLGLLVEFVGKNSWPGFVAFGAIGGFVVVRGFLKGLG